MKIFNKKQLFLAFALPLFILSNAFGMTKNIAGTYQILQDGTKHLSLAHGCIACETGFIRRMSDFGQIFPVFGLDKEGRKIIKGYDNLDATHMTTRLIHALFYRIPDSTSDADFMVSQTILKGKDTKTIATLSAQLLAAVEILSNNKNKLSSILESIATDVLTDDHKKLVSNLSESPWDIKKYNAVASIPQIRALSQEDKITFNACKKSIMSINKVAQQLCGDFIINQLKPLTLSEVMYKSLDECDPTNQNCLFIPHTTQMIFLGFVYKACGHDRAAIAAFYTTLNKELNGALLQPNVVLDDAWQSDIFKHMTQGDAIEAIQNILVNNEAEAQSNTEKNFEYFIYYQQQIKSFPAPIGFGQANIVTPHGTSVSFSMCMEGSVRSLLNTLAYNPATNCFDLDCLKQRMKTSKNFHPDLENFYKKFPTLSEATSIQAGNEWAHIVSNITHVLYITDTDNGSFRYELRPAIKTIIVLLNHLLNLDLFEGNSDQEINRPDFVAHYFPVLCKRLGAQDYYFSNIQAAEDGDDQLSRNIDQHDLKPCKLGDDIYSTIVFADSSNQRFSCELMTRFTHAGFKIYCKNNSHTESLNKLFSNNTHLIKKFPSLNLLFTQIFNKNAASTSQSVFDHCTQILSLWCLADNIDSLFTMLFVLPLEKATTVKSLITKSEMQLYLEKKTLPHKIVFKDLFLRLAETEQDESAKNYLILEILKTFINDALDNQDLKIKTLINQAISAIQIGIKCNDSRIRSSAIILSSILVQNDLGFDLAIDTAKVGVNDSDAYICGKALCLFKDLVNKSQGSQEAITAAQQGINDGDYIVRNYALQLLRTLVENGQEFELAIAAAQRGIYDSSYDVRSTALHLFEALMDKNQAVSQGYYASLIGMIDTNKYMQRQARVFRAHSALAHMNLAPTLSLQEKALAYALKYKRYGPYAAGGISAIAAAGVYYF